jgi:hypothetical protein
LQLGAHLHLLYDTTTGVSGQTIIRFYKKDAGKKMLHECSIFNRLYYNNTGTVSGTDQVLIREWSLQGPDSSVLVSWTDSYGIRKMGEISESKAAG